MTILKKVGDRMLNRLVPQRSAEAAGVQCSPYCIIRPCRVGWEQQCCTERNCRTTCGACYMI
ncbi:hypothetical protein LX16_1033 [Stackebrandtia albiflava]|uniref:Uncharacterized protein n=1 Tax=Stackebrandtia albiflava TaxID=406432 RepID=A0A562VBS5_9ACTN|nr:hypothetical protein [Stackebrandtia albiflava]TWJ15333.1 hypothetical protein LX16_1033 [Stackebrandtia albiflava]